MKNVKTDITGAFSEMRGGDFIFKIGKDFIAFKGHFPDEPLLPGIVQIEIAAFCARKLLNNADAKLKCADKVKFIKPVRPDTEIICRIELLSLNADEAVFKAAIKDDKETYSQITLTASV
ncbi:MAG: hypothetical protein LBQ47_07895 [Endomicrobium sp.]|jgi:3-hydroxyacyl-[acyl-carrier-protein] dehydratase|nr:hypothetical protein [Endomicrobium sp.]